MTATTWRAESDWLREPDLAEWIAGSRLNLLGALADHAGEESVGRSLERYLTNVSAATTRLVSLSRTGEQQQYSTTQ